MTETTQVTVQNFNAIKNKPLQAFNRTAIMFNLIEDFGKEASEEYASQFSVVDMLSINMIIESIKSIGLHATRMNVTKDLALEADGFEYV